MHDGLSITLAFSPLATMWTIHTVYKISKSAHYMDNPSNPLHAHIYTHTYKIPTTTVPMAMVPLWYWYHSSLKGSASAFELPLVVRIIWKRLSLSEQCLDSEAQWAGNWSLGVCHKSMKLCTVECRVTGRRCISEMTCWWPGGEEVLFSFTAEDRNVARTRRTTGMPHIPQCWKQSKVGEWEKNQISTKRCQQ